MFTKTRVCSSSFGSTNFGARLSTKIQICLSCFGFTNLGHSASFNLRTAFLTWMFGCGFSFPPLILSFHRPCAPRQPRWSLSHYFGRDPPMSLVSRLSHPFHLPVPRNSGFVAAANLSECFVVNLHDLASPCDIAVTFAQLTLN